MLLSNHGGNLRSALLRSISRALEHVVPEVLPAALVLLPPASHGRHVVARRGADAHVRVAVAVAKLGLDRRGGHALNAETHDHELVQDTSDARGDHAKVLAADKHARGVEERRQLHHGLVSPVLVLLAPEEGLVHGAELVLGIAVKLIEGRGLPHLNARVKLGVGLVVVAKEDDVVDQCVHALQDLLGLLVADGRSLPGHNIADRNLAPETRLKFVSVTTP
mmetsp:Transcript_771/g.2054  ORF Transcript_771/g.2054 Transcript_771/m.2054 type:complete len:221 (+) Transcript_771:579-1241(+)